MEREKLEEQGAQYDASAIVSQLRSHARSRGPAWGLCDDAANLIDRLIRPQEYPEGMTLREALQTITASCKSLTFQYYQTGRIDKSTLFYAERNIEWADQVLERTAGPDEPIITASSSK